MVVVMVVLIVVATLSGRGVGNCVHGRFDALDVGRGRHVDADASVGEYQGFQAGHRRVVLAGGPVVSGLVQVAADRPG
jgi:hypothetical protein